MFLLSPWHWFSNFAIVKKVVYHWNYQPRPFLAFKHGGFIITEYIFPISFRRKTFKWLLLPSSSQEIPEMRNAAIYSFVSSTGEEMSEKDLVETQRLKQSVHWSSLSTWTISWGKPLGMICQKSLWWRRGEELPGFVSWGYFWVSPGEMHKSRAHCSLFCFI